MHTRIAIFTSPTSMSKIPIIMVIYITYMDEIDNIVMDLIITLYMEVSKDITREKAMVSKPLERRKSAR